MAQAAATQQAITEQTQMVGNGISTAQSQAATATYSTYVFNVTQTSQAILDVHAAHTAQQASATKVAYSLTATSFAALQADIVRTRNVAERRALWREFVVTPLKIILSTLVVLLYSLWAERWPTGGFCR
jgi:glucan phosphoethanolaminetransferase (alkaline phosphatase superfamily)